MSEAITHEPVMIAEVFEHLQLQAGQCYLDGTLGLAGHALEAARQVAPGGTVIAFDWDADLLEQARGRWSAEAPPDVQLVTFHADYRDIAARLVERESLGSVHGALLDLGVNNVHFADPDRGFSFRFPGPLDMRMDRSQPDTAATLLNTSSADEIARHLREFGDERWAVQIARVIVDRRRERPLETTDDLVDCVLAAIPAAKRDRRIHPATRTFQAMRIWVNGELDDLESTFCEIAQVLAPGGRLAVLAYHSGEDRAAKRAFRTLADQQDFQVVTKRPLVPTDDEVQRNPKSRSAKLRVIERLDPLHQAS